MHNVHIFSLDTYKLPVIVLYMKVVQLYQGGWEYSVGGVEGMPPTENISLRIFMGIYLPKNIDYSLYFDQLFWYGKKWKSFWQKVIEKSLTFILLTIINFLFNPLSAWERKHIENKTLNSILPFSLLVCTFEMIAVTLRLNASLFCSKFCTEVRREVRKGPRDGEELGEGWRISLRWGRSSRGREGRGESSRGREGRGESSSLHRLDKDNLKEHF